ncbi:type II toxin-antitoxin system death-on-curing family toxin [Candidatus Roizmanbacteria bacterium]|nr:type II toxin-antitoxin system death-on-curing family toxin [Candidatus Roizmanbacteria bacterium]
MTQYLAVDEVLVIHEQMIRLFGGRPDVHDFTLLHSAVERPKATFGGSDLYATLFGKAAALIQSLILNHPFDDGNKRTAITSCAAFLAKNGWILKLPKKESIQFTLDVDSHKLSLEEIASWIKRRKHHLPKSSLD